MNLIIYGNSHLGYFWKDFKHHVDAIPNLNVHLACLNFLETGNSPTDKNTFFKEFRHKKSVTYGDKSFPCPKDFKDFTVDHNQKYSVLLVSLGLHGDVVHGIWGGFNNCQLPFNANLMNPNRTSPHLAYPISTTALQAIYDNYYRDKAKFLEEILGIENLNVISWLSSPNLSRSAALYSMGHDNVDSGNLKWHYDIQDACCKQQFLNKELFHYISDPNAMCCGNDKLIFDQYKLADENNHANGMFYSHFYNQLIADIIDMPH